MPQVAAQEAYSWKPSLMTGFLEKFLTFIRDVMAKVEDVAYVFEWNPEWEGICFTFDPDKTKGRSSHRTVASETLRTILVPEHPVTWIPKL